MVRLFLKPPLLGRLDSGAALFLLWRRDRGAGGAGDAPEGMAGDGPARR
jgi:hypothetical protein